MRTHIRHESELLKSAALGLAGFFALAGCSPSTSQNTVSLGGNAGSSMSSGGTTASSAGGAGFGGGLAGSSAGGSSAPGGSSGSGGAGGVGGTRSSSGGIAGAGGVAGTGGSGAGGASVDAGRADVSEQTRDGASERLRDSASDGPRGDAGGCSAPCIAPLVCVSGSCACPGGQSLCGTECIDTTTNPNHCGSCDTSCSSGQACAGGTCASDGCTDQLAGNLTLSQVAVYQVVKIPIMKDGNEVAASSRNAAVVQGHDTMFRLFVTPSSGFSPRELSARLTLTPSGGSSSLFYSRKTISAASTDADANNSFQIPVPASAMSGSMRYAVQIVECGSPSGSTGATRFPASGDVDLGVKTTGGLRITILPIQVGNYRPDTSETALAGYASQMMAMYPVTNVTFTVGTSLTMTSPVDWSAMLDKVRAQRTSEKPASDVYYFGLVKPADTLRTYCGSSCTTGIGYVVSSATGSTAANSRAAVGIGFGDKNSYLTMAHEVGHNHGRNHAPCSTGGTISGVDPNFAYAGGLIGSWGYDARTKTLYDPSKSSDIMSYCTNQWMSDYTYGAIVTRVAAVNGVAMVHVPPQSLSRWRILLLDDKGPRWGIPITDETPPEGEAELATAQDAAGNTVANVVVYRTLIADMEASMIMIPEPRPGWSSIAVAGTPAISFANAK